jgi:hypothetical protein
VPERDGDRAVLGGWSAEVRDGSLHVEGDGEPGDWWRVAVTAAWWHLDATGEAVDTEGVTPPG